ncbi:MAG: hypothetical protein NTU61_00265 [Candidatus Altiarchaeota archaeon]|nr:hypothetical protein [Candidatus Altiarchaeota archaeon]
MPCKLHGGVFDLVVVGLDCRKTKESRKAVHATAKQSSYRHANSRSDKRQKVYNIIHKLHELQVKRLAVEAEKNDIVGMELKEILKELEQKGLVYCPKRGVVGCVD